MSRKFLENAKQGINRKQRKEKQFRKVDKSCKGRTKRYDSYDDNGSETDSELNVIGPFTAQFTKVVAYRTYR